MLRFSRPKRHLTVAEERSVVAAITRAEEGNLGEVRVHIEERVRNKQGALARAEEMFYALAMEQTMEKTGVLLYVAIKDRVTAVYAGEGIHTCCAEAFWQEVTDRVAAGFKEGKKAEGLVEALEGIGDLLREHVPGEKAVGNELPDEVSMS